MVDGLERSEAQRIAALEARVAELERGNPTCVCGAGAMKDETYPLPWSRGVPYNGWTNVWDKNSMMVCQAATPMAADIILSLASRLEAAEKIVEAARDAVIEHPPMDCFIRTRMMDALSAYDKSLAGEGGG